MSEADELDVLRLAASGVRLAQIAERRGVSLDDAAQQLGVAAKRAVQLALDIDAQRQVELTNLDLLRSTLMPQALRGDVTAARLLVRIHVARAALLGLAVPVDDEADELDQGVAELDRIRARREQRRTNSTG